MLIAWAATVVLCSLLILTVKYGAGLNIWDVPEADYKQFVKVSRKLYPNNLDTS